MSGTRGAFFEEKMCFSNKHLVEMINCNFVAKKCCNNDKIPKFIVLFGVTSLIL